MDTLTYDDSDLPDHYGWKATSRLEEIERECEWASRRGGKGADRRLSRKRPYDRESQVGRILRELDDQGRWISTYNGERLAGQPKFPPGHRYLSSAVCRQSLQRLSEYLKASRPDQASLGGLRARTARHVGRADVVEPASEAGV